MPLEHYEFEKIVTGMTVNLIYYLVEEKAKLPTSVALKLLNNYAQKIRNAAKELSNEYGDDKQLNEFRYKKHLSDIYKQLDIDTNIEMYDRVIQISKEMYQDYVNKYNFPNNEDSAVRREYFQNVEYAILGSKISENFTDENGLLEGFKFTLNNLMSAKKVLSEEEFYKSSN